MKGQSSSTFSPPWSNSDLSSAQGAEGLPLAHGPTGALHVQPPPAEDPGSDADDGQLVPVRVDGGRPAEPRPEHPGVRQRHHVRWPGVQPVLPGPLGLHDGCG